MFHPTNVNEGEISNKLNRKLVNVLSQRQSHKWLSFNGSKEDLIYLDMNFEDASKFIMSAGSINPEKISFLAFPGEHEMAKSKIPGKE